MNTMDHLSEVGIFATAIWNILPSKRHHVRRRIPGVISTGKQATLRSRPFDRI